MERGGNITLVCKEHQLVFVFWFLLSIQKIQRNEMIMIMLWLELKTQKLKRVQMNYFFSPVHTVVLKF